jgi:iron complex outermembrane receptor protein
LHWLHFENVFSIVRGKNKHQPDSVRYLPFIPAPRYQSRLRADFQKASHVFQKLYFLLELDHNFRQNQYLKENRTETATPAYTLVNAGIGAEVLNAKGKPWLSIYIAVNNIFDKVYQNHLSRLKYAPVNPLNNRQGIYNMGRNLSIKIVVPFTLHKTAAP